MRAWNFNLLGKWITVVCIGLIFLVTLKCKLKNESAQPRTTQLLHSSQEKGAASSDAHIPLWQQSLDFEKLQFSNWTGNPSGCFLVPNYIHFLHFGGDPINYIQLVCILAAFKNQRPEKIFFHYNNNATFSGKYWKIITQSPKLMEIVELHQIELPKSVFGQPLSEGWRNWHGSDVMRIKMIMKYGGIFLDNDCYLVKSVDDFRRFEISVNWDEGQFLGNQVIVAHKDARFLKEWLNTYKVYDHSKWYYNGGERPTVEVLYKKPELVHRVKVLFGADLKFGVKVTQTLWPEWKDMYILHLLSRHQYLYKNLTAKATFPVEFNETNIAYYPISLRDMAYDVYDIAGVKWPKDKIN